MKMKSKIIFILLIINTINIIFSLVPNWNFEKSTTEITIGTSKDYTIFNKNGIKMIKRLTKDSNGKVSYENMISVNNGAYKHVDYENIDSAFNHEVLGQPYLVYPRGKFHPYNPETGVSYESTQFIEKGNWDLHCFEHSDPYYFYTAYFSNKDNCFHGNKCNGDSWEKNDVHTELYAIKLIDIELDNNRLYPLLTIAAG